MALFTDDAVERNGLGTYEGKEAIRDVWLFVMNTHHTGMDCENYQVKENTILYECTYFDDDDSPRAGERYEAVRENGKIKSNLLVAEFDP